MQRYRWWQPFSRSLFHLRLRSDGGSQETWTVDVRLGGDSGGEVWARLYRDGINQARSKLPAAFAVPGGTIISPIQLPAWMNISLLVVTILASTERALRLRYNWILDGGIFDGDVG